MTAHVLAVDGSHLAMRAYHVTPQQATGESEEDALSRRLGQTADRVRGMLATLLNLTKPTHLVVAVDTPAPTWRHALDPLYKAPNAVRRGPSSATVLAALAPWWGAWSVCVTGVDGWAADDLLATLVVRCEAAGTPVTVVSGDRDLLQLAGAARVLFPQQGKGYTEATPEWVREYTGVHPLYIADWKAIGGDLADGIPRLGAAKHTSGGLRNYGFTERRAAELVSTYDDLEGVYHNLPNLPQAEEREWLAVGEERAYLSRQIAWLDATAPLEVDVRASKTSRLRLDAVLK